MVNRLAGCLVVVLFSIAAQLSGQAAQLDSAFVETFTTQTRVNGGLRYRDNGATFSVNDREELQLNNESLDLRIGGRYKWLGYTFSIPLSDLGTGSDLGQAKSLGANLQFFRPKFYVNVNARRTTGFERDRRGEPPTFQEDIRFFNALLFGFRILNSRKFSIRSSFRQRERQLRSAGSWLLGGALQRQLLKADSLEVPLRELGTSVIERYGQTKVGVGLGYAHTFVFQKIFFATPLLIAGPELRFIHYEPVGGSRSVERTRLSARIRGRLAFGANGRRNYAAVTASYLPSADNSDTFDTRVDELQIELTLGHRIGIGD